MVVYVKEEMKKNELQEQAVIGLLWTCLMNAMEWNKKEELVTEQALKHLKVQLHHLHNYPNCTGPQIRCLQQLANILQCCGNAGLLYYCP